jgi:hypothetical protein
MKLLLLLAAYNVLAQDPKDIMRRAMERDERNLALLDTYMYERRTVQKMFDKDGKLKQNTLKVHEVFRIDGSEIERLIEKDGKPLSAKDQASEQKRVDKEIEKIKGESPSQRAKRRGETAKDRQEEIEARREVLEAFDFQLKGIESIRGRDCWAIRGDPKPGFNGRGRRADQMKKVKGTVWIDQQSYEFTRMELDSLDTISFGWFLFRLQPGAKIRLDQALVNDEVWLPQEIDVRADARLLGKMLRVGIEVRYGKFRKFSSDSKLVVGDQ